MHAKEEGVPFTLNFEDVRWPTHCPALGVKLDYEPRRGRSSPNSPSFDRLDATRGYVRGNVVVISFQANRIKTNAMPAEIRAVADWLDRVLRGNP